METIIVNTNSKKEFAFIKSVVEPMKIRFQVVEEEKERKIKMTKEEYGKKLERARNGKKYPVTDAFMESLLK
jgi:ribosomal protein L21